MTIEAAVLSSRFLGHQTDLFGLLTTEPNAEVGAIHAKAMPVILTKPEEIEQWMTAESDVALRLQRPLADGSLRHCGKGCEGRLGRLMILCEAS